MNGRIKKYLDVNILRLWVLTTVMFIIIFRKFIFEGYEYVVSYDAAYQFIPYNVAIARLLKEGKSLEWSFHIGIGGIFNVLEVVTDIFKLMQILIGDIIYIELLKVYFMSFFTYLYLKKIKFTSEISIYGAVTYSFCGIMIIRSAWYSYTTELVYFAILIYTCELFFQDKKKRWLIVCLVLEFYRSSLHGVVIYSIVLLLYTIIRYYIYNEDEMKSVLLESLKIYVLSLLMSAAPLINLIWKTLNAGRFSKQVSNMNFGDWFPNKDRVYSVICSFFSESLSGICNQSNFSPDGLSGPIFYFGIINIFLIVIAICKLNGRAKIISYIGLGLFILYLFCPNILYLYNMGISSNYYKLSVAWIAMLFVILACHGMSHTVYYFDNKAFENNVTIYICFGLISILVYFTFIDSYFKENIVKDIAIYCIILCAFYMFILTCIQKIKTPVRFLTLCLAIEYIFMSVPSMDQISVWSSLLSNSYNSELNNICLELQEGGDFFRMDYEGERTEPLMYNYYGTSYWNGYMGNSYIDFLQHTIKNYNHLTNRGDGAINNPLIEQLLGVRYMIKPKESKQLANYIYYKSYENYDVFYNPYAYELLTIFDKYMYEYEYEEKDINQKQLSLLDTIIVDEDSKVDFLTHDIDDDILEKQLIYPRLNTWAHMYSMSDTDYEFDVDDNADMQFILDKTYSGNFIISFIMTGNANSDIDILYRKGIDEIELGKVKISEFGEMNTFVVDEDAIDYFLIRVNNSGRYKINDMRIEIQDIYSQSVVIAKDKLSNFIFTLFENNHIKGEFYSDINGKVMIRNC